MQCGCMNCCFVVKLRKCHHAAQKKTHQLMDKNNFDMFYKIDSCAAIHGRIWMNNVPNESRIIMLSCTEISFVISFFDFEKFWVKPGFPSSSFLLTLYRLWIANVNFINFNSCHSYTLCANMVRVNQINKQWQYNMNELFKKKISGEGEHDSYPLKLSPCFELLNIINAV